ncbi:Insect cuticle protein [Cinara cedri]|uniref:Insect cuticle protein n=1 Tax=Cinara cedri TaxID=506608 RepID=A0A5E4M3B3_9HEMI|nr:Insect cuticle protein [Cinara cedri]
MTGVQICLVLATSCFLLASAKPSYKFAYGVQDLNTKDLKEQQEYRDDDNQLHGYYKTLDADGLMRTVTYKSHPSTGFEAHVDREPYHMPDNNAGNTEPISRYAGHEDYGESPITPTAEPSQLPITRPVAWSMSMMHRIDPAAPPIRIASFRRAPIVLQQQDPNFIQYGAPMYQARQEATPLISHGYAANTGGYIETKTASTVIHPSPIATPIGSLQSQYSYGQPSAYDQSYANTPITLQRYGYPAERGATVQYYSTAATAIPQYDSQSYSDKSYSPGYKNYLSEITPSYSSQSSGTFHAEHAQRGSGARSQYDFAPTHSYLESHQLPQSYFTRQQPYLAESADPSFLDKPQMSQYNSADESIVTDAEPCEQ